MVSGRYARVGGNYCLPVLVFAFVLACLVGAWMSVSSSLAPIPTGISTEQFVGGMPRQPNATHVNSTNIHENNGLAPESHFLASDQTHKDESKHKEEAKEEKDWMEQKVAEEAKVEKTGAVSTSNSSVETSESRYKEGAMMSDESSVKVVHQPEQTGSKSQKEKYVKIAPSSEDQTVYQWKLCNVTAGPDYIPCLDNIQAIKKLKTTKHYEHRERHCPVQALTCLVDLPKGYRTPIRWPKSRDMIWFNNAPHPKLVEVKGGQNWVKIFGQYLTFPGGGTQFKHGVTKYIDFIQKTIPEIAWGKQSRVILDVGCGVASFGGYHFEKDVLTMSLAPKDEHESQVQFALERGIPAILAVMGTKRLPFPAMVFDVVHCARCRVPWHIDGGKLLLELNRVLRPGGYFVWSATPVYKKGAEDTAIWKDMSNLTKSMCWEMVEVGRDKFNSVGVAIFKKPSSNSCYEERQQNDPPLCEESDDRNAAWYTPLQACMHKIPGPSERGGQWPVRWPSRLDKPPYWLKGEMVGASDELASKKLIDDTNYWKNIVSNLYLNGLAIDWSSVRNIMDMRASYGGFAAAMKDMKVWVMNVVPVNSRDILPIIYERGLFGLYHDWCESFSTYPRSYDLLHANHLFSELRKRCNFVSVMAEVDRILRPGSWLIVRDDPGTISEVENMAKSLQWKIQFNDNEGLLCAQKSQWRPSEEETIVTSIA